jgi:hypothetical protein
MKVERHGLISLSLRNGKVYGYPQVAEDYVSTYYLVELVLSQGVGYLYVGS